MMYSKNLLSKNGRLMRVLIGESGDSVFTHLCFINLRSHKLKP